MKVTVLAASMQFIGQVGWWKSLYFPFWATVLHALQEFWVFHVERKNGALLSLNPSSTAKAAEVPILTVRTMTGSNKTSVLWAPAAHGCHLSIQIQVHTPPQEHKRTFVVCKQTQISAIETKLNTDFSLLHTQLCKTVLICFRVLALIKRTWENQRCLT